MDNNKGANESEFRLADEERQPCEIWTRCYSSHGVLPPVELLQSREVARVQ